MATSGLDGHLKVWDIRKWEPISNWSMPRPGQCISFSQKGLLSVGWGSHVSVSSAAWRSLDSH
jgi:U3 small nucleolar RNA-associated protein 7